jgi:RNA polymerase sigma factor (TIGR02999 family)
MDPSAKVTELLRRHRAGEPAAADALLAVVYADLHARAEQLMRSEPTGSLLQPTALVHEAWFRVERTPGVRFDDRYHFMRLASRAMRNALIDHARNRRASRRRGSHDDVELDSIAIAVDGEGDRGHDVLDLNAALERLGAKDPQLVQIVELRFFAGLTLAEVGEALGLTISQVHRAWTLARSWLHRELREGEDP